MSKSESSMILDETSNKHFTGWDMAVRDAERRIRALKAALALFKQRRDAGEPWPGTVEASAGGSKKETRRLHQE